MTAKPYSERQAEIIGKGIARLLEQINQYTDKMKVLVISPIYLGEKVWQDGYDQEFSLESVEVSKKLEPVYEKVAGKYGKRFMRAADYASPSEADQEHMDGQSHKILADAIYKKIRSRDFIEKIKIRCQSMVCPVLLEFR